ncbi:MAG: DNA replication/repair protein RecF [Fimbriimonadales bacterium]|nr:DNA replication/repair protein RecF [Fimbriimonadales bacterium]
MFLESFRRCGEAIRFETLRLRQFRNYSNLEVEFGEELNLLIGPNAQGKSNLLEAISVISTTRSFRGAKDKAMIQVGAESSSIAANLGDSEIGITIPKTGRRFATIGESQLPRIQDLLGRAPTIAFASVDLELIVGEPSWRRRFVDLEISQFSAKYLRSFSEYKRSLEHRNALLKRVRDGSEQARNLEVWDKKLSLSGATLREMRSGYLSELSVLANTRHMQLAGDNERLSLQYQLNDDAVTANDLIAELERKRPNDIVIGATTCGPHRDDIEILVDGKSAFSFASQGQSRTAVLAIKLAQMDYWTTREGRVPALLLDDIFSDLDVTRRQHVLEVSRELGQVFVTATDLAAVDSYLSDNSKIFYISNGTVRAA